MIVGDVVDLVRVLIGDSHATLRALSDAHLIELVNAALRQTAIARPDLFATAETVHTETNAVYQELGPAPAPTGRTANGTLRLIDVMHIGGGSAEGAGQAITRVDFDTLLHTNPDYAGSEPGVPEQWARHPQSPTAYILHPRPKANITIHLVHAEVPAKYATVSDTIVVLSDAYTPMLAYCAAWLAELQNAEASIVEHASVWYGAWQDLVNQSVQARVYRLRPPAACAVSNVMFAIVPSPRLYRSPPTPYATTRNFAKSSACTPLKIIMVSAVYSCATCTCVAPVEVNAHPSMNRSPSAPSPRSAVCVPEAASTVFTNPVTRSSVVPAGIANKSIVSPAAKF